MRGRLPCLALLLALTACGNASRTQSEYVPSNVRIATASSDTIVSLAPVVLGAPDTAVKPPSPPATAPGVEVALASLGGSTLRGLAHLTAIGASTAVATHVLGGHGGATYAGAVRLGTCGAMGASVAPLNPVTADSLGTGASASRLSVPLDSLLHVPTVVVFGPGGRPQACGEIG
ncbi:MAG TPA: hypothetical protein VFL93_16765 [Longimicrobiaceae bacterium]|jgi:hypothetical protein|nr:hypothetical protein [Longimicrobiaceae bacterium]